MTDKKIEIEFAPGCFDNFEGTQEELDALVAQIKAMAEDGSLLEESIPIEDLEDLDIEDLDDLEEMFYLDVNSRNKKIN